MKKFEIITKILKGTADADISFSGLCKLLNEMGLKNE